MQCVLSGHNSFFGKLLYYNGKHTQYICLYLVGIQKPYTRGKHKELNRVKRKSLSQQQNLECKLAVRIKENYSQLKILTINTCNDSFLKNYNMSI
jgi:hypothetical protein